LTGPDWCDIDYIHYRSTIASWRSWKFMIRTAFERLSPGGWLELQEPECDIACDDAEIPPDNALKKWFAQLSEASIIAERPIHETPELKRMLEEAGFVDVQEKVYKIPLNGWPSIRELKEVGHMWQVILDSGFSGFSYALFHRHLKMSKEEIEVSLNPWCDAWRMGCCGKTLCPVRQTGSRNGGVEGGVMLWRGRGMTADKQK
jgi:hypothetical protein